MTHPDSLERGATAAPIGARATRWLYRLGLPVVLAAWAVAAQAQAPTKEDIVIGASVPMSGVFAFAGIGIHAGLGDYVKWANEQGGIDGRKLRYVPEDTAYKVDV